MARERMIVKESFLQDNDPIIRLVVDDICIIKSTDSPKNKKLHLEYIKLQSGYETHEEVFGTGQFSSKKKKAHLEPFVDEYPGPDSNRHGITANGF